MGTDFAGMLTQRHWVAKATVITDKLELEGATTLCKLEEKVDVDVSGIEKDGGNGVMRVQCKYGEHVGWVTVKQGKGEKEKGKGKGKGDDFFLRRGNPFTKFCMDADKVVAEAAKGIENVSHSLNAKMRQGGT